MTAPAPSLVPGAVFAQDFQILRPLSAGGMGQVYVARQLSTSRERALKVMLPGLANDEDMRRRFAQEARVGSLIDSRHVVEVVGAGIDAETGSPWLAMELLVGEDVAGYLERAGPTPATFVIALFDQVCHAIGAAHDKGIIHRDLKPENIFLSRTPEDYTQGHAFIAKVLDFGIAKLIVPSAKTMSTAAIGTPLWMAPEQADKANITPAADVWALGLIAFRLLTGKHYWKNATGPSAIPVLREVLVDPIERASERARQLGAVAPPPGFDEWFARCLERDPMRRYANARVMLAELHQALRPPVPVHTGTRIIPSSAAPVPITSHFGTSATVLAQSAPVHRSNLPPPPAISMPPPAAVRAPPRPTSRLPLYLLLSLVGVTLLVVLSIALSSKPKKKSSKDDEDRPSAAPPLTPVQKWRKAEIAGEEGIRMANAARADANPCSHDVKTICEKFQTATKLSQEASAASSGAFAEFLSLKSQSFGKRHTACVDAERQCDEGADPIVDEQLVNEANQLNGRAEFIRFTQGGEFPTE